MPLPTLTYHMSTVVSTGYLAPTDAQVLAAINSLITAQSTYWEIKSSGVNYLEIGPKTGCFTAKPNFRAIVCDNPTTGYGSYAVSASGIWIGFAPEGGTLGSYQSATPYGANRFSLYWIGLKTAVVESLWFYETDETLCIVGYDDSAAATYCFEFGAMFDGNGLRTESDGRIYGMTATGTTAISTDFVASNSYLYGYSASNNQPHTGCFRPYSPTVFDGVNRLETPTLSATSVTWDIDGNQLCGIMNYSTRAVPYYCIGKLRQKYFYKDMRARQTISTVAGVVGYTLSAQTAADYDAMLFANQ